MLRSPFSGLLRFPPPPPLDRRILPSSCSCGSQRRGQPRARIPPSQPHKAHPSSMAQPLNSSSQDASSARKVLYRVTKDSLMERLNTDMHETSLSISKECSFFTVHGSADEVIPVEDAYEFAKHIPTHKLRVIEGADHCYTAHRKELSDAVVDFIMSNKEGDTTLAKDE